MNPTLVEWDRVTAAKPLKSSESIRVATTSFVGHVLVALKIDNGNYHFTKIVCVTLVKKVRIPNFIKTNLLSI